MGRQTWHVERNGAVLTLARHWPPRFDVEAETSMPDARRLRLAHQIRQDMWRRLQRVRGFSPVVRVERQGADLIVRAGGRVLAPFDKARINQQLILLLTDPDLRERWSRHARLDDAA
ncbi:MAG: hypothetical protein AAFQ66_10635 [Pseudomonadota bacterium]